LKKRNTIIEEAKHYTLLKDLTSPEKIKVLLAQALFGNPDILVMDEPTNDLDAETTDWLCNFLADYENIVIVVSHDRHFLDMVCTHVVDVDFGKVRMYSGNYTFWYETSQLLSRQISDKNKKIETKRAEMMDFIARFSANASKSRQATSRKKALEKLNIDEIRPSSRRYPFIHFKPEREPGDVIFECENLTKAHPDGGFYFQNVSLRFNKGEKMAIISRDSGAQTAFFNIISGEDKDFTGTYSYGQTISPQYIPNDNTKFFKKEADVTLVDWLRDYFWDGCYSVVKKFLRKRQYFRVVKKCAA